MSDIAIKVENLSKQYRLGEVGTGTISHDLNRWWHQIRGKKDPYLKIGEINDRSVSGGSEYVWALKDINFEVKQGQVLGIIGKNGAGKSTLLKILSRVTSPTTGIIRAKGRVASLLEVGTGFHPEMTGRENIFMNGTIMGMNRHEIKAKLEEIVEFAGIAKYLDTPVKRYSSGMTVRLGFAIAAHLEPEILIVDEVLAVGDAEFQKKAIGKMQDVSQGKGRTVLFVSHNMASIESLCQKGLVLENGQITHAGDILSSLEHYTKIAYKDTIDFNNGVLNLKDHPNKTYNRKFGIQSVKVIIDGISKNNFTSGSNLEFYFDYSLKEKLYRPVLGIVIKDQNNTPLVGINNKHTNQNLSSDLEGTICVRIEKLSLYGNGPLRVDLYFGDDGNDFDTIIDAFSIDLLAKDVYKSGFMPDTKLNKIYVPNISYFNV